MIYPTVLNFVDYKFSMTVKQHFNICHPLLLCKNLKTTRTLEVCIIG